MKKTAREVAGILGVPVDRVKRWSRGLFPPDPKAGRWMGRARFFSKGECFALFLAEKLVSTGVVGVWGLRQLLNIEPGGGIVRIGKTEGVEVVVDMSSIANEFMARFGE